MSDIGITMTRMQILEALQGGSLRTLAGSTGLSPELKLQILRTCRVLEETAGDLQEVQRDLVEELAERDEDGKMVPGETPGSVRVTDPTPLREFLLVEERLPLEPLSAAQLLESEDITPAVVLSLGPLVR